MNWRIYKEGEKESREETWKVRKKQLRDMERGKKESIDKERNIRYRLSRKGSWKERKDHDIRYKRKKKQRKQYKKKEKEPKLMVIKQRSMKRWRKDEVRVIKRKMGSGKKRIFWGNMKQ